jgi:hypothetical protein
VNVTIVKAVQTCVACPSQWDAWDSAGNYWYLRYRSGLGQARQYALGPGWFEDGDAEPLRVLTFEFGDPLDGSIGLEKFAELAGLTLELAEYTGWEEHFADELQRALEEDGL